MNISTWIKTAVSAAVIAVGSMGAPAFAGDAENAFLAQFDGSWRGRGEVNFRARGTKESVLCRMKGNDKGAGKLGLDGSCALAGRALKMKINVEYSQNRGQFVGVLRSNTAFDGEAIGSLSGSTLTFELPWFNESEKKAYRVLTVIKKNGENFSMSFSLQETASGKKITTADVPFSRG